MHWLGLKRIVLAALLATVAAACTTLPPLPPRTSSTALASPGQTRLGQWVAQRRIADRAVRDSGFMLLADVDAAYAARLALVHAAQQTLDLQYYAIHADATTERLLEALRQAARRGVRVRILLDDFNTVGRDAQVLRLAFEPNVQLRLFNPLPGSRASLVGRVLVSLQDLTRASKRMHNKLFIADNAVGVAGGRNLGDAYFGADGKSNFIDLDVLAAGRIVRDMSASFDRYWNDDLAYPMESLVSRAELDALRPDTAPDGQPMPPVLPGLATSASTSMSVQPLDLGAQKLTWASSTLLADAPGKLGPDDDEADAGETVVDGLLQLMHQARQEVLIVTPYFVPGPDMLQAFRQLRARGVRVRVLTNSLASNDAIAAHAGYARHRQAVLGLGVELHEMRAQASGEAGAAGLSGSAARGGLGSGAGGSKSAVSHASLHSKVVVIDGRTVVIGSMNLDLRSQRKNSEVALVLRSAAIATAARAQTEAVLGSAAYRLELRPAGLLWKAPPGAAFGDSRDEPLAGAKLKALAAMVAPFAPDEML